MTAFFQFLTGWQHFCVSLKKPITLFSQFQRSFTSVSKGWQRFHMVSIKRTEFPLQLPKGWQSCPHKFPSKAKPVSTDSNKMTAQLPHIPTRWQRSYHIFHQDDSAVTTYSNKMTVQLPHIPIRWQRSYHIFHHDDSAVTTDSNRMTAQLPHIPTRWQRSYQIFQQDDSAVTTDSNRMTEVFPMNLSFVLSWWQIFHHRF